METKKLNALAGLQENELEKVKAEKLLAYIQKPDKHGLKRWRKKLMENRTRQDFFAKDLVLYRQTSHKGEVKGEVIEVVKAGRYPNSPVRIRGFYKDYITYVVLLTSGGNKTQLRWCPAARLTLLQRSLKGINKHKLEVTSKQEKLSK